MNKLNLEDNFGRTGTDIVTGFKGVITGCTMYLYGCEQYYVVPKTSKDGKRQDGEWFDVARIKVTGTPIKLQDVRGIKGAEISSEKLPAE